MREILYGRRPVLEALRARRRHTYRMLLARGVERGGIVQEIINLARCPVQEVDRQAFENLGPVNHQGVALEVSAYPLVDLDACLAAARQRNEPPLLLALDHLQDPQNVGSLLRTAEAMAVHGVILPRRRAVGITPAVSNTSAGAVEHLSIAEVSNLAQTLDRLKERNVWVVGLAVDARAQPLGSIDLDLPLVLVVGAEDKGLSRLIREKCELLVSLPMYGQVESLNAAVAGSIALFAARQARAAHVTVEPKP